MNARLAALAASLAIATPALADTYAFTVSPTSTATWNFSVAADFVTSGDPRSFILGNYDALTNPTGTRTLPGLFGSDNGLNNPISITDGGLSASGSSGGNPLHPAGGMSVAFNPAQNLATISGLSLDLLNGAQIAAGATTSITYNSFRTRNPSCTIIGGFPIEVPLGDGAVTGLTAVQDSPATGTLTPTGNPGEYTLTVPMMVTVTITATLNGAAFPIDPQSLPIVVSGTVTLSGDSATMTSTIDISDQQSQPGPIAIDPLAFDEPLCGGRLLITIVLASVDTTLSSTISLASTGTRTCTSPAITQQPQGLTVTVGEAAAFSVAASGSAPLAYQWRRGTTALTDGGPISGATSATLTINPAAVADAGAYSCTVSNPCGVSVSAAATLTVNDGPPTCDADYNQDGNADQDDVAYLVNVIAGGPNPTGRDPDFNLDGNVDQEDYIALVNVVAGGPCP
jgi:hypothetical protein